MYEAHADPYVYAGTETLKNLAHIKNAETLKAFELEMTNLRLDEGLPLGDLDALHFRKLHKHLFQDIYSWAGQYRKIRMAKDGNWFCYPEHIESQISQLFIGLNLNNNLQNMTTDRFAESAAKFLSGLNAIHAFRDGNGRTQLTFITMLAREAGHPLRLVDITADAFLFAMIDSFKGNIIPLETEIRSLLD